MRAWLKEIRRGHNLTQQQVAEEIGISRCYYTQLETCDDRGLKPRVAIKLGKVLGFDWRKFYEADVLAEENADRIKTS